VLAAAPGLGDDLAAHQERELDAHAREADALATRFRAGREVVVAGQLTPSHAEAVVYQREGARGRLGQDGDRARARIEGIRDDLGEDGLIRRAWIGVAQVLEETQQIDPGLTHGRSGKPGV
jgi:hypothetical protein